MKLVGLIQFPVGPQWSVGRLKMSLRVIYYIGREIFAHPFTLHAYSLATFCRAKCYAEAYPRPRLHPYDTFSHTNGYNRTA
jgi:hypothetical protein